MQRVAEKRGTHIIMFGLTWGDWLEQKTMIKNGLQSMHMGWTFTSGAELTAEGTVRHIREREDLELVTFCPDYGKRSCEEMRLIAAQIAKALSEHPHKPWVHIQDSRLDYLRPVFEAEGLLVECGLLEYVISERWIQQIPKERIA